ncbi:MAG: hypothetical protein KF889_24095 [Alphaproteobacteria bacterium]|nr:hypothetical protein [Alphaproteobacteria bacterium]MCW5742540.1 hypothetical protein [Alphaproteobacteria bacterium]
MQRARLHALLESVEERIALAQAAIGAQHGVIEELRRNEIAASAARTQLTVLEIGLAGDLAERDRLRAELAALPPPYGSS